MVTTSEAQSISRTHLYHFLSEAFVYPGEPDFLSLHNVQWDHLDEHKDNCMQVVRLAKAEDRAALCVEYSRLFVGPYDLAAPPYGSIYLENGNMVQGASTAEVKGYYQEIGLRVQDQQLPDHIQTELEFLYCLGVLQAGASQAADYAELARVFENRLFFPWVGQFAIKLSSATRSPYYRELAALLAKATKCKR